MQWMFDLFEETNAGTDGWKSDNSNFDFVKGHKRICRKSIETWRTRYSGY